MSALIKSSEVSKLKKRNHSIRDIIYIHLNEREQYVVTNGIEFAEFADSLYESLNNLLLLKHRFDEGDFNRHTLHEYVSPERLIKLMKDDVYGYGDFCWIDFEEEDALNELSDQGIAELLYLGHMKDHLKPPFYNQLSNKYVYLAHDDGFFNKTYYRNFNYFYKMLGTVIPRKVDGIKVERSLFGFKKTKPYPLIANEIVSSLKSFMKEGVLLSIKDAEQSRARIEIPIWVIGDFADMDDMYDEYEHVANQSCDAKLVFDKKSRIWKIVSN